MGGGRGGGLGGERTICRDGLFRAVSQFQLAIALLSSGRKHTFFWIAIAGNGRGERRWGGGELVICGVGESPVRRFFFSFAAKIPQRQACGSIDAVRRGPWHWLRWPPDGAYIYIYIYIYILCTPPASNSGYRSSGYKLGLPAASVRLLETAYLSGPVLCFRLSAHRRVPGTCATSTHRHPATQVAPSLWMYSALSKSGGRPCCSSP